MSRVASWNSRSVSRTSRTKPCRCRTSASRISRTRGSAVRPNASTTASRDRCLVLDDHVRDLCCACSPGYDTNEFVHVRTVGGRPMPQRPEDLVKGKKRPFTGAEYLESLRDGREVYIYGERVKDVTKHPAFRNAAVSVAKLYDALHDAKQQGDADRADRHRLRRLHAPLLQGRPLARGRDRPARRHRRLGPHHLRLDGPQPRLQGGLPQHAGRQCRVLRQVRRQRARLARARAGGRALRQPRAGQSAHRPLQAGRPGEGRLRLHPEGDRRRHLRLGRQGGRHQLGAHALQLPRPEHGPGHQRPEHGGDVHGAHGHARHQADLPAVLRAGRRRDRLAVGLSADQPLRRERRHLRVRQRLHPLGERVHPSRHRAPEAVLSALGLRQRPHLPGLHALCREARFHRRAAATRRRAPRAWRPSAACRRRSAR